MIINPVFNGQQPQSQSPIWSPGSQALLQLIQSGGLAQRAPGDFSRWSAQPGTIQLRPATDEAPVDPPGTPPRSGTERGDRPTGRLPLLRPDIGLSQGRVDAPAGSVPPASSQDQSLGALPPPPPTESPQTTTTTEPAAPPSSASNPAPAATPAAAGPPSTMDRLQSVLERMLAGGAAGGGGAGGGGAGASAGTGRYPTLDNIPRPDTSRVLEQYDRARPPDAALNDRELYMAGLMGALAGIHFVPGQRIGLGLQGALAGGAEAYSNERRQQRQTIEANAREGRQHAAGRATLEAQLSGQDYDRQVAAANFDRQTMFHQDQMAMQRAQLAQSAANSAQARQLQALGLMINLERVRSQAGMNGIELDTATGASMIAPRISGAAGAGRALTLPPGLPLMYGGRSFANVAELSSHLTREFEQNNRQSTLALGSAGAEMLRNYVQRGIETSFIGTLNHTATLAGQGNRQAQELLLNYQNFIRRSMIVSRSQSQPRFNSNTDNLD